ncbi:MAG: hypothetical protein KBS37_06080, partial [Methanocorpusculum sp.]|nr:hypothetical protein [Candidatus Methanocorpusculum equi]
MKWIVAVFAVLVLMSVFVGAVSAEGETAPTNLKLDAKPASISEGESVTFTFSADGATKYSLVYDDGKSDSGVTSPKTHQYDKAGTYTAILTAYNESASSTKDVKVTVTEKVVEPKIINSVTVTLSASPQAGNLPSSNTATSNTEGVKSSVSSSWNPSSRFEVGKEYTVTVTPEPKENYKFSSESTVT